MKKFFAALLAAVMVLGMLTGCGSQTKSRAGYQSNSYSEEAEYEVSYAMLDAAAPMGSSAPMEAKSTSNSGGIELPAGHKWIITMNLRTETDDLDATLAAVGERISALNGYVESQNINNGSTSSYNRRRNASLTVRIPADQLDSFIADMNGLTNVTSSSRYVQDITLAYTDTEGRLNSLKAEEERLLELMKQAKDMSDILAIENRMTEVRYELESYASTLRLYDNQVDYATVDLYISEVTQYTPTEDISFWKRISDGLSTSIVDLGEIVVDFIAGVIIDLPYLICIGLFGWVVFVLVRRCWKKRKAKKEAKKVEER